MIKRGNGVVTSSKDINMVFEKFYRALYTSDCTSNTEEVFSGLHLPTISGEQIEKLNAPITEEKISATMLSMKTGKLPCRFGQPPVMYYDVYLGAFETGCLPSTFDDSLICLIPKRTEILQTHSTSDQ